MLPSGGPISSRPISSVGTTSVGAPAVAPIVAPLMFVNGQTRGHIVALGMAIGGAVFFQAATPAAAIAAPAVAQFFDSEQQRVNQVQPWFAKVPVAAQASPAVAQFFAKEQPRVDRIQPWFAQVRNEAPLGPRAFYAFGTRADATGPIQPLFVQPSAAPLPPVFIAQVWAQRQELVNPQPRIDRAQPAPTVAQSIAQIKAAPQASPAPIQPQFYQVAQALVTQAANTLFLRQQNATNTQPLLIQPPQYPNAPTVRPFFVSPGGAAQQIQPAFFAAHPSAITVASIGQWFAAQQADQTATQPNLYQAALSVVAPDTCPAELAAALARIADLEAQLAEAKKNQGSVFGGVWSLMDRLRVLEREREVEKEAAAAEAEKARVAVQARIEESPRKAERRAPSADRHLSPFARLTGFVEPPAMPAIAAPAVAPANPVLSPEMAAAILVQSTVVVVSADYDAEAEEIMALFGMME
jgi:hypothetical protein